MQLQPCRILKNTNLFPQNMVNNCVKTLTHFKNIKESFLVFEHLTAYFIAKQFSFRQKILNVTDYKSSSINTLYKIIFHGRIVLVCLCLEAGRETMTCCLSKSKTTKSLVFHSTPDQLDPSRMSSDFISAHFSGNVRNLNVIPEANRGV